MLKNIFKLKDAYLSSESIIHKKRKLNEILSVEDLTSELTWLDDDSAKEGYFYRYENVYFLNAIVRPSEIIKSGTVFMSVPIKYKGHLWPAYKGVGTINGGEIGLVNASQGPDTFNLTCNKDFNSLVFQMMWVQY